VTFSNQSKVLQIVQIHIISSPERLLLKN